MALDLARSTRRWWRRPAGLAFVLAAVLGWSGAPPAVAADLPDVSYSFNGVFDDEFDGSSLTPLGACPLTAGCNSSTGWGTNSTGNYWSWASTTSRGGGLVVTTSQPLTATYTMALKFSYNTMPGGWAKIIDYANRASDNGFYFYNGYIQFYDAGSHTGSTRYSANSVVDLVVTRDDATDLFTVYARSASGSLDNVFHYTDTRGQAVPYTSGQHSTVGFFFDDSATSGEATSGGKAYSIKMWAGRALTAAQVDAETTVPGPPASVVATPGDASASVAFTAPTSTGGSAITKYTVTAVPSGNSSAGGVTAVGTSSPIAIAGLTNGTSYTFTVTATNDQGTGPKSEASAAVTPSLPLSPASVAFGTRTLASGASSASTLTYTNHGASAVTLTSISVTGVQADQFAVSGGTCSVGATVNAGASCTILTTFDPSSVGDKSATVSMVRSDATSTVELTGTGTVGQQTVTWSPTTSITAATATVPSATATTDGGGAITYEVTSQGGTGCAVNATTGALTYSRTGTCTVRAVAAATDMYTQASASVSFVIGSASQSIAVSPNGGSVAVGSTQALASSGSGGTGAVTYAVASGGAYCSIAGTTLRALAVGSCTVTATIAADALWGTATSTAATFTIDKATPTVAWAPTNTSISVTTSPLTPDALATTSGDGAITYSVTSDGGTGCAVDSATGVLTFGQAGTCVVRATSAATATYAQAYTSRSFTINAVVPGKPYITGVSGGSGTATVTFTAPTSTGGSAITSYVVTGSPNGSTTCAPSGSPLSCDVTGLNSGQSYTFTVAAVNTAGTGSASDASPAITPSASVEAPAVLTLESGNQAIGAAWTAPPCIAAATCGTFQKYVVEYSSGASWTALADITNAGTLSATINGLDNGTSYNVRVTVTTNTGSATVSGTQVPAASPGAPRSVVAAKTTSTAVRLSWLPPASDGGAPITTYVVSDGSTTYGSCTSSPCTITGLTSGQSYSFSVAATNRRGTGGATTASAVTMGIESQSITLVAGSPSLASGSTLALSSSGTSGTGDKTFTVTSGSPSVCTLSGAVITGVAVGDCVVRVSISSDSLYSSATSATVTIPITRGTQAVTWNPTTSFTMTDSEAARTLSAASVSPVGGGSLSYGLVSGGSVCSITVNRIVTFTSAGSCVVRATAAQTAAYNEASRDVTLTVSLATRSVSWSPTTALTATSSGSAPSALPTVSAGTASFTYSVDSAGTTGCAVNASTAVLTFSAAGTCVVRAVAPADTTYGVASTTVSFVISSSSQTITAVSSSSTVGVGATSTLSSTGSTGAGAISFAADAADEGSKCSVSGTTLTGIRAGTCRVTATIAADGLYSTATSSVLSVTIAVGTQTVAWNPETALYVDEGPYTPPAATASGQGDISYQVTSAGTTACTVNSATGRLTFTDPGDCTVQVSAAPRAFYYSAAQRSVTFSIDTERPTPAPSGAAGGSSGSSSSAGESHGTTAPAGTSSSSSALGVGQQPAAQRLPSRPGLPENPVRSSIVAVNKGTTELTLHLPSVADRASIERVVFIVRDLDGRVVEQRTIAVRGDQEVLQATFNWPTPGYTFSSFTTNALGVSAAVLQTRPGANVIHDRNVLRDVKAPLAFGPITFRSDSAELTAASKKALNRIGAQANEAGHRIAVTGFARFRSGGNAAWASSLATQRASNVAHYLASRGVRVWIRYAGADYTGGKKAAHASRRVDLRWASDAAVPIVTPRNVMANTPVDRAGY